MWLIRVFIFCLIIVFNLSFSNDEKITLVFTGDNLISPRIINQIEKYGEDYPYEKVTQYLKGDIVFGNLEAPITNHSETTRSKSRASIKAGKNFVFKISPRYAEIFKKAGFNVFSLANNHTMDFGEEGLKETFQELKKLEISYVGAGRNKEEAAQPLILECKGYKIGFLAYSMIIPVAFSATNLSAGINAHPRNFSERMRNEISQLKSKVDLVVVSYHWGVESHYYPTTYQKEVAHKAINAGADIIIGHHPHRIQGVEIYKGGVIAYSLGNFLFAGKSPRIESFILKIEISQKKITTVELVPIWVINGRPEYSAQPSLIQKIKEVNKSFASFQYEGDRFVYRLSNSLN